MKYPKPTCSLEAFGRVVPNDWPLQVPAKWMLQGPVVEGGFWHAENPGKAPVFIGPGAAEKALRRLYRRYGYLINPHQAGAMTRKARRRSREHARQFRLAVILDRARQISRA